MKRLECLDGLRGVLAVYVMAGHMAPFAALPEWAIRALSHGGAAVDVFFILSGLVIIRSLESHGFRARPFLIARAARIFPVFLVMFAAGVLVQPLSVPWSAMPWVGPDSLAHDIWSQGWPAAWPSEIAAHLTMTHGLFPNGVLPDAWVSFLGAAWSLSTEWQFYVLALFLGRAGIRGGALTAVFLALAAAGLAWDQYAPEAWRFSRAFLPNKAHYFALGLASAAWVERQRNGSWHKATPKDYRVGWRNPSWSAKADHPRPALPVSAKDMGGPPSRTMTGRGDARLKRSGNLWAPPKAGSRPWHMFACVLAATLLLCGVRGGGEKLLPPLLWTLCLSGQLWPMRLAFVAGPLRWRAVRFLGAVSYPLYLANEPIQKGLGIALAGLSGGEGTIFTALWLPTALLVPLGVAVLLHRWVETPGLRWGRSLARRGMMPTTMEYGTAGLSAGVGSGAAAAPLCRTGFERR